MEKEELIRQIREQLQAKKKVYERRALEIAERCKDEVREIEEQIRIIDRIIERDKKPIDEILLGRGK